MGAIKKYHEEFTKNRRFKDINKDLAVKGKVPLKPTDWVSSLHFDKKILMNRIMNLPILLIS